MTEPAEPPSLPPWRWPRKWLTEETFWREMTTRTLSALLAALVLFLGARSAGFFSHIQWSAIVRSIGASSGIVGIIGLLFGFVISLVSYLGAKAADRHHREMAERVREHIKGQNATIESLYAGLQRQYTLLNELDKKRKNEGRD